MYCELQDNVFPIYDIEIHIKASVRTLPTEQKASTLKWACHAGNGTYKSRLACSVAVKLKTILYVTTVLEYSPKTVLTKELQK